MISGCRGSKAYDAFTRALSSDDSYSWIVEELTKTDVSGIKTNSAAKSGRITGINANTQIQITLSMRT